MADDMPAEASSPLVGRHHHADIIGFATGRDPLQKSASGKAGLGLAEEHLPGPGIGNRLGGGVEEPVTGRQDGWHIPFMPNFRSVAFAAT